MHFTKSLLLALAGIISLSSQQDFGRRPSTKGGFSTTPIDVKPKFSDGERSILQQCQDECTQTQCSKLCDGLECYLGCEERCWDNCERAWETDTQEMRDVLEEWMRMGQTQALLEAMASSEGGEGVAFPRRGWKV